MEPGFYQHPGPSAHIHAPVDTFLGRFPEPSPRAQRPWGGRDNLYTWCREAHGATCRSRCRPGFTSLWCCFFATLSFSFPPPVEL